MAIIAAVNFTDKLVLLEDGRELPIAQFYGALDSEEPLTIDSTLFEHHRVSDPNKAQIFAVELPGSDNAALLVEIASLGMIDPINNPSQFN